MKSRVIYIMALLLIFSAGLVEPLHAAPCEALQSLNVGQVVKGGCLPSEDGDPGDSGETLGDPDGWLGGQNLRPTPPIVTDTLEQAPPSPGGFIASLLALIHLFMIL